jgi:uncharacterized protein with FMN-binding domain
MRRVVAIVIATLGGLALLASFHTSATSNLRATAPSTGSRPPATAPPPQGSGTDAIGPPTTGAVTTTTTAPGGRRTVDGSVVSTRYGDVQVRVVLQGGQIVDVQALTLPSDRARSARISDFAGPALHDEVLQAQSANIDIVSGATYTSDGYAQSLQAALDRAGIHS